MLAYSLLGGAFLQNSNSRVNILGLLYPARLKRGLEGSPPPNPSHGRFFLFINLNQNLVQILNLKSIFLYHIYFPGYRSFYTTKSGSEKEQNRLSLIFITVFHLSSEVHRCTFPMLKKCALIKNLRQQYIASVFLEILRVASCLPGGQS